MGQNIPADLLRVSHLYQERFEHLLPDSSIWETSVSESLSTDGLGIPPRATRLRRNYRPRQFRRMHLQLSAIVTTNRDGITQAVFPCFFASRKCGRFGPTRIQPNHSFRQTRRPEAAELRRELWLSTTFRTDIDNGVS